MKIKLFKRIVILPPSLLPEIRIAVEGLVLCVAIYSSVNLVKCIDKIERLSYQFVSCLEGHAVYVPETKMMYLCDKAASQKFLPMASLKPTQNQNQR